MYQPIFFLKHAVAEDTYDAEVLEIGNERALAANGDRHLQPRPRTADKPRVPRLDPNWHARQS